MPRYETTGYQWFCLNDGEDDAGSNGGFDGSRPDIRDVMEREAKAHTEATGHQTVVERVQRVSFAKKAGRND